MTVLSPVPQKDANGNRNRNPREVFETGATAAHNAISTDPVDAQTKWFKCKSVIVRSGDECWVGSWVFVHAALMHGAQAEVSWFAGACLFKADVPLPSRS